jgi:hypothetical protein
MRTSWIVRGLVAASLVIGLTLSVAGTATADQPIAGHPSAVSTPRVARVPDQLVGKCDQVGSARLPKTRFLLHAGLAFGAFHRYILKPLQAGAFSAGATSRVKSFLKAAVAGAFIIREVLQMDKFANADKTLCKIVPNIDGISTALSGFVAKLWGGTATAPDLSNLSSTFDTVQSQAGSLGATIKDRATKIPGA